MGISSFIFLSGIAKNTPCTYRRMNGVDDHLQVVKTYSKLYRLMHRAYVSNWVLGDGMGMIADSGLTAGGMMPNSNLFISSLILHPIQIEIEVVKLYISFEKLIQS